jgi:hypothetical protein
MKIRPDWVKCVQVAPGKSWCGMELMNEFAFQDADHAALTGRNGGCNVACRECVSEITEALKNGHDDPEYLPNV